MANPFDPKQLNNEVLLFGNYGVEVIRLSQLYDPSTAAYVVAPTKYPVDDVEYFLPEVKQRIIYFNHTDDFGEDPVTHKRTFKPENGPYYIHKEDVPDQDGYYVPAPQSLVVVDPDSEDKRWGTYSLLCVDSVDTEGIGGNPPTYASVLVPFNFTGGVSDVTRAIEFNNNTMALYVDDVNAPVESGALTYQRLVPDRKLMMYGSNHLRYVIKKTINGIETVICTNSINGAHNRSSQMINFVRASYAFNGTSVKIETEAEFKGLVGKFVSYTDRTGAFRTDVEVILQLDGEGHIIPGTDCARLFEDLKFASASGDPFYIKVDGVTSTLDNVQIPAPSYLVIAGVDPLISGEIVTFEVYETIYDAQGKDPRDRLVFSSKLTVKSGTALATADVTDAVITGLGIKLDGEDTSDVWNVAKGTRSDSLKITPYLTLDDGGQKTIDLDAESNAFCMFGLEQIDNALAGTEFDVLFKYFPSINNGIRIPNGTNIKYTKVPLNQEETQPDHPDRLVQLPSVFRRYFVKNSAGAVVLAENNGHPEYFTKGVEYMQSIEKFSWETGATRPNREMLICKKRIRIVETEALGIHKITPIPIWDNSRAKWSFNFLVNKADFTRPVLVNGEDSSNGSVVMVSADGEDIPSLPTREDGSIDDKIYNFTMYWKPDERPIDPKSSPSKMLALQIQHWNLFLGKEKWLMGWTHTNVKITDPLPYGSDDPAIGVRRPFINCVVEAADSAYFYIPTDKDTGFPNLTPNKGPNMFLDNFYQRAISSDEAPWARTTTADGVETKTPTHFLIRSATDDGIETQPMKIVDGDNIMAYGGHFRLEGLPIPTDSCMGIVIVEFLYYKGMKNGIPQYDHLVGVPVEVRIA